MTWLRLKTSPAAARALLGCCALIASCGQQPRSQPPRCGPAVPRDTAARPRSIAIAVAPLVAELVATHGRAAGPRIRAGLAQVARLWRPSDGTADELAAFARAHFVSDPQQLADTFGRLQYALEMIDGHGHEVHRELSRFQLLDEQPERPIDRLLASYSPDAHVLEDLFRTRIAFVALLNFPLTTLEQRLSDGRRWSRERWAQARLTGRFEHRVPAAVRQEIARTEAAVRRYIDGYNIHMGRLVSSSAPGGAELVCPFAAGLKLVSHWGLRDEIRAQYGRANALQRQRLIAQVMARIVRQEIPQQVIDAGDLQWDPRTNLVRPAGGSWRAAAREPDARYARMLDVSRALRAADPYYPTLPTHVHRVFLRDRELPRQRVQQLLHSVLTSAAARQVAALVSQRLGRPLEPFDIWYPGFRSGGGRDEQQLDATTRQRYPDAGRLQADLPRLLRQLGFDAATATWLAQRIVVDPARGAGHADGALRREGKAHLRTRFGRDGLDYKGFNIAIHELGHNVEQVFSISRIDHTLLAGVPNTGFTEAFAFVFQARDRELLGEPVTDPRAGALRTLDRFWTTFEIAGVAVLDIEIWRWLVDHPDATAAQLRRAMVRLAREVWNRYFAPVLGVRDSLLLAIYSHIIAYGLYTPDYPLGLLIAFQIEEHLAGRQLGPEMERMCRLGRLAPDVWMERAVGQPVSAAPLLAATARALRQLAPTAP